MTTTTNAEKPLFVPLKREWFEAFERGAKTVEYRRLGRQFTERSCRPGRRVTLSLGYSGRRLFGTITGVCVGPAREGAGLGTYGPGATIISIGIELDAQAPRPGRA